MSETRERSPLRVWQSAGGYWLYEHHHGTHNFVDGGETWVEALAAAGEHFRTCPALRLARLEAELEKLAAQYFELSEFVYPDVDYLGEPREAPARRRWEAVSDVYRLAHDELTAVIARHRGSDA